MFEKRKLLYVEDDSIAGLPEQVRVNTDVSRGMPVKHLRCWQPFVRYCLMDEGLKPELDGVGIAKVLRGSYCASHYASDYTLDGQDHLLRALLCMLRSLRAYGDGRRRCRIKPVDFTR